MRATHAERANVVKIPCVKEGNVPVERGACGPTVSWTSYVRSALTARVLVSARMGCVAVPMRESIPTVCPSAASMATVVMEHCAEMEIVFVSLEGSTRTVRMRAVVVRILTLVDNWLDVRAINVFALSEENFLTARIVNVPRRKTRYSTAVVGFNIAMEMAGVPVRTEAFLQTARRSVCMPVMA